MICKESRDGCVIHRRSSSGGSSRCSDTYFPFFFRWRTHSVSRYSICPLTERKSSSAQAAIALYSFSFSLSGTCFFAILTSRRTVPPKTFSRKVFGGIGFTLKSFRQFKLPNGKFSSVQTSRVDDRLRVMVSAEDDQQIRNHRRLALLIQIDRAVLLQTLQRHLNHADRAVNNHFPRVDHR